MKPWAGRCVYHSVGPWNRSRAHEEDTMTEEKKGARTEEFKLSGGEILDKFKDLLHEGNIRRIILKDEKGRRSSKSP